MQKHYDDTIKTSGHNSLEKYTSQFIWKGSKELLKVLLCERWVGGWTELQHIDPHSYGHNSFSFPFSWDAQPGASRPSLSGTCSLFQHLLSNCLTSCLHPGYIIVRHPPSSCGRHKSHSIQSIHGQGYILIFLDWMHLLFTQVDFQFWQLGRGQYVTEVHRALCRIYNSFEWIYIYIRIQRNKVIQKWWIYYDGKLTLKCFGFNKP